MWGRVLAIVEAAFLVLDLCEASNCKPLQGYCTGNQCNREQPCDNGVCQPDGSCLCNPCYSGKKCDVLEDKNFPYFVKKEEKVYIDVTRRGLIYDADAVDEDDYKTCSSSPQSACPCSSSSYELFGANFEEPLNAGFSISGATGEVKIMEDAELVPGEVYHLNIAVSNLREGTEEESDVISIDTLELKVYVQESNYMEDFLRESEIEEEQNELNRYSKDSNEDLATFNDIDEEKNDLVDLTRSKREAYGPKGSPTNFSLSIMNEGDFPEPLKAGATVDFNLEIILPEVDSGEPLDMTIEVYVMDTISGITTFALCGLEVTSVGSGVMNADTGAQLTAAELNSKITIQKNEQLTKINDRGLIDFGTVYNTETGTCSGANCDPSTITISFSAVYIPNAEFTNDTATVTAGAEYNGTEFVWVSQASFDYDSAADTYPTDITMSGPDEIPENGGGQFDIVAYIADPFMEEVLLEIYTPNNVHDIFSVTGIQMVSRGINHQCLDKETALTRYKSVSAKTNHRAVLSFPLLVLGINYADLQSEVSEEGNKMTFSFTIANEAAQEGDIISIGAGMMFGTNKIWTAMANLTIGAAGPESTPTEANYVNLDQRDNPPVVYEGQTAAIEAQVTIEVGSLNTIECSATPQSDNKICGVKYGNSGKYAASFPDLLKKVTYDEAAGSAEWTVVIAGGVTQDDPVDANEDYVSFEVTVVFNDPDAGADITCVGVAHTFTVTRGEEGLDDISGKAFQLGDDTSWYEGSQAAFLATITFPAKGVPYNSTILETSGDFLEDTYYSRVCDVTVMKIGRGAACMARVTGDLANSIIYKKSIEGSVFTDSAEVEFGESCGAFISGATESDYEFSVRVTYDIPLGQSVAGGSYNLSLGYLMANTLIWTGWATYDVMSFATFSGIDPSQEPIFNIIQPEGLTVEEKIPFIIQAIIKAYPGSVGHYKIKATSADSNVIEICRIVFLNVGRNYACIDTFPYGKEEDPQQTVTIIHDSGDWHKEAVLDMGIIRNLGSGKIFSDKIADEDAIEIGIIARGMAVGPGSMTVDFMHSGGDAPDQTEAIDLTIDTPSSTTAGSATVNITSLDETLARDEYYEDVMKQFNVDLHIPPGYSASGMVKLVNNAPADVTLCYAAVAWAGLNVPCVIPHMYIGNKTEEEGVSETIELNIPNICYIPVDPTNLTESVINVRVGVATVVESPPPFNIIYLEDGTEVVNEAISLTKTSLAFNDSNPDLINIEVYPVDNSSVITVEPGNRFWHGIYIYVPPFVTTRFEMGVLTDSIDGHATATVHGFRWGETQGSNIGCIQDMDAYDFTLMQNATDSEPMYHESQTDTLVVPLKYLTNTGISVLQKKEKNVDNLAMIEVDLWIADHEALSSGDYVTVRFSLKYGNFITVFLRNFTISKPATDDVMVLETVLNFTDPTNTDLAPGEKLDITGIMKHVVNESHIEAYDARVRFLLPSYMKFANDSAGAPTFIPGVTADVQEMNITNNFSAIDYVEFDIDFLFFTDIITFNLSVTVDPYGDMPKGLGTLPSTVLLRLVCRKSGMSNPPTYCGDTKYLNYMVQGNDCFENLKIDLLDQCRFEASTAIDEASDAYNAAATDGSYWSPADRDPSVWEHFIIVDLARKARVTRIDMTSTAGKRTVTKFDLLTSFDGVVFTAVCDVTSLSPGAELPKECRTESRFFKFVIKEVSGDAANAIAVNFKWFGCYIGTDNETCVLSKTTMTNNVTEWRHAAYDSTNGILYFCDDNPKKKRLVCYSSLDADSGAVWNALPSYIGSLAGPADGKMYAYDRKRRAMIYSEDGVDWRVADPSTVTIDSPPVSIPGKASSDFTEITIGGSWTAQYDGLYFGGTLKVNWNNCCG